MSHLLEARSLVRSFQWKGRYGRHRRMVAIDGVDLELDERECLALVGESGSGKTTLGRCLVRLLKPDSGTIRFDGDDLLALSEAQLRRRRRHFQMIFQDSASAFNPRQRVRDILAEPLKIHRLGDSRTQSDQVARLLEQVGLGESTLQRYPHQLSGGQRQRLSIARALAVRPRLVILDEPVASLDVSVQAQVLSLLEGLRDEYDLAMVFISHDLTVVRQMADRLMVLYLGQVVESATRDQVFQNPQHPYTVTLLEAVPVPDLEHRSAKIVAPGEIPSPLDPPKGCRFHPRCPIAGDLCTREMPPLRRLDSGTSVACHYPGEISWSRELLD